MANQVWDYQLKLMKEYEGSQEKTSQVIYGARPSAGTSNKA